MALVDNLVAYWSLDDLTDAHGNNDLTNNNSATFVTGKVGNAADFEADSSQSLSIVDNADLSMGDIDFTIAFWSRFESLGNYRVLVSKDNLGTTREYTIYYAHNLSRIAFFVTDDGSAPVTEVAANNLGVPSTATWYFVVAWHNSVSNTLNIQVNNGTPDSISYSGGVFNGTSSFRIGAYGGGLYHDGLVDEVGVWKRVLTSDERTELYNGGSGRDYAYIVATGGEDVNISGALGALTLAGLASTVVPSGTANIAANLGALTLTGLSAIVVVSGDAVVAANLGTLVLAGQSGAVVASGNVSIAAALAGLTLAGLQAAVSQQDNIAIDAALGALQLAGLPATVVPSGLANIVVNAGGLTLTGLQASVAVSGNATVQVSIGLLILAGLRASVLAGERITPAERTFIIAAENRIFVVAVEDRIFRVS